MKNKLKAKANSLPTLPGVYLMKDREGSIIYVGKSKHLKQRVSSYFGESKNKPLKVQRMVRQIDDFEYILTDTELDALLLECELIKKIKPLYNRMLKNDSRFRYIHLNEHVESPFWESVFDRKEHGIYFGPYDMKYELQQGVEAINQYYRLGQCKGRNPFKQGLAVVNDAYLAPGHTDNMKENYKAQIEASMAFLKNEKDDILSAYEFKMRSASENLQFEVAQRYKELWQILCRITYREKAIAWSMSHEKIIAYIPQPLGGFKVYFLVGATIIKTLSIKKKRFLKCWYDYFNVERPTQEHIEKGHVDRAYIIYNYLHRHENCEWHKVE